MRSPEFLAFKEACIVVADRYDLAPWTVEMACLLEDYQIEEQGLVAGSQWIRTVVVTEIQDPLYLAWLGYYARLAGLGVMSRVNGMDQAFINVPNPGIPEELLTSAHRPPKSKAFSVRVEVPPMYPPEAAQAVLRATQLASREVLKRLGY